MEAELARAPKVDADRFVGALWGAALGDAMGWPFEERAGRVAGGKNRPLPRLFEPWVKRSGGRFRPYEEVIEAGAYSDDTQLLLAVARARTRSLRWWEWLAEAELPLWTLYERGGGGATLRATKQLLKGELPWSGRVFATRDRYFAAGGNGVAMRIAPHCLAHADSASFDEIARDIMSDGVLTHGHPRALLGALVYGYALWTALQISSTLEYGELITKCIQDVEIWSKIPEISDRWPDWVRAAREHDLFFDKTWVEVSHEIVRGLHTADEGVASGALALDAEILDALGCFDRKINGAGTVSAIAAIFLASRHAAAPLEGVTRAALAVGADTDTLASMTGGLLGAITGTDWLMWPIRQIQDHDYIRHLAEHLASGHVASLQHQRFTQDDAEDLAEALLQGHDEVQLPMGIKASAQRHDGVRSKSSKLEADAWLLIAEGETLIIKQLRDAPPKAVRRQVSPGTWPQNGSFAGIAITVADLDRSARFYNAVLGLAITRETGRYLNFGPHLAIKEASPGEPPRSGFTIFIEVDDVRSCRERCEEAGGGTASEIGNRGGRDSFLCRDPDGNRIEVIERSSKRPLAAH